MSKQEKFNELYQSVHENKWGWHVLNASYQKDMSEFYQKEYYQKDKAAYQKVEYAQIDLEYRNNCFAEKLMTWNHMHETQMGKSEFLDIGCGEGYALAYFYDKGWNVTGIDLSVYGIELHNPQMKPYLIQGTSEEIINDLQAMGKSFDFINGDNVLEHVPDPEKLLMGIKKLCKKETLVCMKVPNDFSMMQKLAYEMGEIDNAFWVTTETCEHINYFSVESLTKLGEDLGFEKVTATADWPIDFFLLNPASNYQWKKEVGHDCHIACVTLENALNKQSIERTLVLKEAIADCGIGRNISVYFRLVN